MNKKKIFLTGSTGNVGKSILNHIDYTKFSVTAALRDPEKARNELGGSDLSCLAFDFEKQIGFDTIENHDVVFLLRPPQIGNVRKYIEPFLDVIEEKRIALTVFLSVQGADKRKYLPHSKIERMIREKKLPHLFLRPSYFMDNLVTTLYGEMQANKRIFLPSKRLKLNWIDVDDIGAVCAELFEHHERYGNEDVYTLTNTKNQGFEEVVDIINNTCKCHVRYESPGLLRYIVSMRKKGHRYGYIAIMLLLHFLPRFEKETEIHGDVKRILKREPRSISQFVEKHREKFDAVVSNSA